MENHRDRGFSQAWLDNGDIVLTNDVFIARLLGLALDLDNKREVDLKTRNGVVREALIFSADRADRECPESKVESGPPELTYTVRLLYLAAKDSPTGYTACVRETGSVGTTVEHVLHSDSEVVADLFGDRSAKG